MAGSARKVVAIFFMSITAALLSSCNGANDKATSKDSFRLSADERIAISAQADGGDVQAAIRMAKFWFISEGKRGCGAFWFRRAASLGDSEALRSLEAIDDGSKPEVDGCR